MVMEVPDHLVNAVHVMRQHWLKFEQEHPLPEGADEHDRDELFLAMLKRWKGVNRIAAALALSVLDSTKPLSDEEIEAWLEGEVLSP